MLHSPKVKKYFFIMIYRLDKAKTILESGDEALNNLSIARLLGAVLVLDLLAGRT